MVRVVQLGDPVPVALMAALLAVLALAAGRPRVAVAVLTLIAVTSVSSQALKVVLAQSLEGSVSGRASFPSGHATAAMTLALAAVLASPRPSRAAGALLGGLVAFGVGASTVGLGWHLPSDVLGGYLLAAGWTLVVVAALRAADRRFPVGRTPTGARRVVERIAAAGVMAAAAACTSAVLLAGAALLAGDPGGAAAFAREHTTSVLVAAAVGLVAVALPATVLGLLGESPSRLRRGSAAA